MKHFKTAVALILSVALAVPSAFAATDKEKAFTDAYKKAFESKDAATLNGFLYTKGADPEILGFYTMMMTSEMGSKISSIELVDLTPEDLSRATAVQPLPSGQNAKLVLNPVKKLVMDLQANEAFPVFMPSWAFRFAEHDGKFVIPVPGPVK